MNEETAKVVKFGNSETQRDEIVHLFDELAKSYEQERVFEVITYTQEMLPKPMDSHMT